MDQFDKFELFVLNMIMKTVIDMLTYCCDKNLIYLLSLQMPFPIHHVICAGSKVAQLQKKLELVRRERERDDAYRMIRLLQ